MFLIIINQQIIFPILSNTPAVYNTNIKQFSLNNVNNYVYLGSTNSPLLNNMGITLDDDGTLMLIKGKHMIYLPD